MTRQLHEFAHGEHASPALVPTPADLAPHRLRRYLANLTISTKVATHPSRKFSYTRSDLRWSLQNSPEVLRRDGVDVVLIHDPRSYDEISSAGSGFDSHPRTSRYPAGIESSGP